MGEMGDSKVGFKTFVGHSITSNREVKSALKVGGWFEYEHIRKGKIIDVWKSDNSVTNEGRNYLLDMAFGTLAKVGTWYIGLYSATVGAFADLTGADIGGTNLTQFIGYSGSRIAWAGVRSGASWSSAGSPAGFAINANGIIKGAFLASDASGTAPYLLCVDAYSQGDRTVQPADTLNVSYVFGMANV